MNGRQHAVVFAALGLVAATSLLTYGRALRGAWLFPALAAAALSMIAVAGLRALRVPIPVALALTFAAGVWFVAAVVFPHSTFYGIVGPKSVVAVTHAAVDAWKRSQHDSAPVVADAGYLTLITGAAWIAGMISAALAGGALSIAAPAGWIGLFVYAASVGKPAGRNVYFVVFFSSLVVYLLADARAGLARSGPSIGPFGQDDTARGPHRWDLRRALPLAAVATAGSLALPNVIPGYLNQPGIPGIGPGGGNQTVVSPVVDIRPRLNQQGTTTMFTVTADHPAYWRLTALDNFDGTVWSASHDYRSSGASIRLDRPPKTGVLVVRQSFRIQDLGGIWLPAAYAPGRVTGAPVAEDPVGATVVAKLKTGLRYTAVSATPQPTLTELRAAGAGADVSDKFLELPSQDQAAITSVTQQVVTGRETSAFDEALAVQSFLRTFRYDRRAAAGSSTDYLLTFLTRTRAGYCEQFAAAMAAMLRAAHIPSRVAIGFLPGRQKGNTYTVTNHDAHAWPEAYFDGIGWIAFEPTPRPDVLPAPYARGQPLVANPAAAASAPTPTGKALLPPFPGGGSTKDLPTPGSGRRPIDVAARATLITALFLLALAALTFAARETKLRAWRNPWKKNSQDKQPAEIARGAFTEFTRRAADAHRPRQPHETEHEFVKSIITGLNLETQNPSLLLHLFQKAEYSTTAPEQQESTTALTAISKLRIDLFRHSDWWGRTRLILSPRPLLPGTLARRVR
jgi:transglutaminase-like putative cysteine protease